MDWLRENVRQDQFDFFEFLFDQILFLIVAYELGMKALILWRITPLGEALSRSNAAITRSLRCAGAAGRFAC